MTLRVFGKKMVVLISTILTTVTEMLLLEGTFEATAYDTVTMLFCDSRRNGPVFKEISENDRLWPTISPAAKKLCFFSYRCFEPSSNFANLIAVNHKSFRFTYAQTRQEQNYHEAARVVSNMIPLLRAEFLYSQAAIDCKNWQLNS